MIAGVDLLHDSNSILVLGPLGDFGQELRVIEPAKGPLGHEQDPPDQRRRVGDLLKALRRRCSQAHGREGGSTILVVRRCFQCSFGKP